jgi:hypothetical protein
LQEIETMPRLQLSRIYFLVWAILASFSAGCATALPLTSLLWTQGNGSDVRYDATPHTRNFGQPTKIDLKQASGAPVLADQNGILLDGVSDRHECTESLHFNGYRYDLTTNGRNRMVPWYSWMAVGLIYDAAYSDVSGPEWMVTSAALTAGTTALYAARTRDPTSTTKTQPATLCKDWTPIASGTKLGLFLDKTKDPIPVYSSSSGQVRIAAKDLGKVLINTQDLNSSIDFTIGGSIYKDTGGQGIFRTISAANVAKHGKQWLCSAIETTSGRDLLGSNSTPKRAEWLLETAHPICPQAVATAATKNPQIAAALGATLFATPDSTLGKIAATTDQRTLITALEKGCNSEVGYACLHLLRSQNELKLTNNFPGGAAAIKTGVCRSPILRGTTAIGLAFANNNHGTCYAYINQLNDPAAPSHNPKLALKLSTEQCDNPKYESGFWNSSICFNVGKHFGSESSTASEEKHTKYMARACGYPNEAANAFASKQSLGQMSLPTKTKVRSGCSSLGGKVYNRGYEGQDFGLKLLRAACFGANEDDPVLWACMAGSEILDESRDEADGIEMGGQACSMIREDEDEAKRIKDAGWSDEMVSLFCRNTYFDMAKANQNGTEGIQQLEQMCWKQKDADACFKMAIIFRDGHTYEVNNKRYVEFLDFGCRYGDAGSCNLAGLAYGDGKGVRKNGSKELSYYKKSCAKKFPVGCYNVGISYLNGDGISKNHAAAYDHMLKACRLGVEEGCDRLRTDCNYHSSPTACSRWKKYNSRR